MDAEARPDVTSGNQLGQGGRFGQGARRDETGDGVDARVEEHGVERRRRTNEDGVHVSGELDEPGRGLVDEARRGDEDEVALGQDVLAGTVRPVTGLKVALEADVLPGGRQAASAKGK